MSDPKPPTSPRVPLRAWLPPAIVGPLAAAWWWYSGHWGAALAAGLSLFLATTALAAPRLHAPVQRALDRIGHGFLQLVTWAVLGAVFAFVFVPGRAVIALLGRDPMRRRRDASATSYLETPPPPPADRFTQQF